MNIQDAKQIKIADYLQSLGYSPVKQQSGSLWYKSPFRRETPTVTCGSITGWVEAATSSLWHRNYMARIMFPICSTGLRNRHRTSDLYLSLFAGNHTSRVSNIWRYGNFRIRHYCATCRNVG